MTTSNFTQGQKEALLASLSKQVSPMTASEKALYNTLREELAEKLDGDAAGFMRCGNFVKMVNMDTFGERYNSCWIKVYSDNSGEYFTSSYVGRRIRL